MYLHKILIHVFLYFYKTAEDDSGPIDENENLGASGDEEVSKNVNNVNY